MKRTINGIIIHCAATPNGKDIKAKAIDEMHAQRGFKRDRQMVRNFNQTMPHIGYHYVIEVDGNIAFGRHLEEIGAHVQGSNAKTIGVCMIGTDKFTDAQWKSLKQLMTTICNTICGQSLLADKTMPKLKEMGISIKGHRDYSPDLNGNGIIERNEWLKICPGFSVAEWLAGDMNPVTSALMTGAK